VWYGVLFASATPRDILRRTSAEVARLAKQPVVRERFASGGMDAVSNTPEEFAALIKQEAAKWKKVVAAANIRID